MLAKKFAVSVFLMLTMIFAGQLCLAQKAKSNLLYAEPGELEFAGYAERDVSRAKEDEFSNNYLILEKFYPIGWSPDGKFAYLVEPPDEACGCYFATLVIQDFRTDKIVWRYNYQGGVEEEAGFKDLKTFWKAKRTMFSRKLRQYKIVQEKRFALSKSDIEASGDVLKAELKKKENADSEEFGKVSDLVLQLSSRQKGRKTIHEEHFKPESYEKPIEAELLGFLKSPFEPRVAFVLIKTLRGWEGFPYVTEFTLVGASLTNGFSK